MEKGLQKIQSQDLQRISQSDTAQALSSGRNDLVSKLLPTNIEDAINEPKLFEMVQATNELSVLRQIEYELIILASLMSVGGNLNKAQVPFVARQLLEMFPKESLADFKICFERGSMGRYGDIQRMDGITIGKWMGIYLEEKYQVLEDAMMKEKDEIYARVEHTKPIIDVDKMLNEYKDHILGTPGKPVLPMTEKEIREEGQVQPKKRTFKSDPNAMLIHEYKIKYAREFSDPLSYEGRLIPGAPDFEDWMQEQLAKE